MANSSPSSFFRTWWVLICTQVTRSAYTYAGTESWRANIPAAARREARNVQVCGNSCSLHVPFGTMACLPSPVCSPTMTARDHRKVKLVPHRRNTDNHSTISVFARAFRAWASHHLKCIAIHRTDRVCRERALVIFRSDWHLERRFLVGSFVCITRILLRPTWNPVLTRGVRRLDMDGSAISRSSGTTNAVPRCGGGNPGHLTTRGVQPTMRREAGRGRGSIRRIRQPFRGLEPSN